MSNNQPQAPQRTWAEAVLQVMRSTGEAMTLAALNAAVEAEAPELVARNSNHWRAKIRQVVQRLRDKGLAENVSKGIWRAVTDTSNEITETEITAPLTRAHRS